MSTLVRLPEPLLAPAAQTGVSVPRRLRSLKAPSCLGLLFFVFYAAVSLNRHSLFLTAGYDLGIFHQAVLAYSRFDAPVVPIKGLTDGLGADFNLLGDHFHPILATLAPLYWVWPDPRALLLAQAALVALSVPAVWRVADRRLGALPALLMATAYGLSIGVQSAIAFDFHEVAFAAPLIAWALERIDRRRWDHALPMIIALLFVKEDMGLLVVSFGLLAVLKGRARLGGILVGLGFIAFFATTKLVLPWFSGHPYAYWSYGSLGPDAPSAVAHLIRHPLDSLRLAFSPFAKVRTLGELLLQTGGLCLLSPTLVLLLPLIAARALSDRTALWEQHYHYSLTAAPILFIAAVDGISFLCRLVPRLSSRLIAAGVGVVMLSACLISAYNLGLALFQPWDEERRSFTAERASAIAAAVEVLPPGATVEAGNAIVPNLLVDFDVVQTARRTSGAPWVVLEPNHPQWPLSLWEVREHVKALRFAGYRTVWASEHVLVLRAPGEF